MQESGHLFVAGKQIHIIARSVLVILVSMYVRYQTLSDTIPNYGNTQAAGITLSIDRVINR